MVEIDEEAIVHTLKDGGSVASIALAILFWNASKAIKKISAAAETSAAAVKQYADEFRAWRVDWKEDWRERREHSERMEAIASRQAAAAEATDAKARETNERLADTCPIFLHTGPGSNGQ